MERISGLNYFDILQVRGPEERTRQDLSMSLLPPLIRYKANTSISRHFLGSQARNSLGELPKIRLSQKVALSSREMLCSELRKERMESAQYATGRC